MAQGVASAPAELPSAGPASNHPPPGRRNGHRHTYGAIDLGTNNCRLLVARPEENGFTVVDAFSRVVRLGEGMATSGKISEAAQDRAVAALAICAEKMRRRRVSLARSVATEACRRAVNGRQFVERVRRETGICLDIISPEEEARLAMLGCHRLLEPGDGPALIFDIGGGSTELVLIDTDGGEPRIKCWWSAPWGVYSLTESEGREFASAAERLAAYGRMRERVRHAFRRFSELLPANKDDIRLMGTSGTVTTLASVHLALPSYDRRAVDGLKMPAAAMRGISEMLSKMSREELTRGLGEVWQTMGIALKFYACVGSNHTTLDAIREMQAERPFGAADVKRIVVHGSQVTMDHVGWKYRPEGLTSAQLNLPFCVATLLLEGDCFVGQFDESVVADPKRMAFAEKVDVHADADITAKGSKFRHMVRVEVHLNDGARMERTVEYARGSERNFASEAQVIEKFEKLAARALPPAQVSARRDAMLRLEQEPDARRIVELMTPPK